jgi:hypothetical protein
MAIKLVNIVNQKFNNIEIFLRFPVRAEKYCASIKMYVYLFNSLKI